MPKSARRCTLFILLYTCCCLQVNARQAGNRISITGRQLSLQSIFSKIQEQTGYYFSYNADIDVAQLMDVHFNNESLTIVLNTVLLPRYAWELDGHSINLKKALPGPATVKRYPPFNDTPALVMGRTLDETVIIAYGTTTQRVTTAICSWPVKVPTIARQVTTNPLLTLQGRVPGLLVTQSGGIGGSAVKVQLRGRNSLVNGTQPLYVIDGIPYNPVITGGLGSFIWGDKASAFNFINPDDVESIDVMKDADATAIYGSRGANGVILITTSKGKAGKAVIRAVVSTSLSHTARKVKLLNTSQYLDMRREAFKHDGVSPNQRNAPDLLLWDPQRYTDWQHELIGGTGHITSTQLSVSGGNDNYLYRLSGHYRKEHLVFPGSFGSTRGGLHISMSGKSTDQRFEANFSGSFLADNSDLPGSDFTSMIMLPPNAPPAYLDDGSLNYSWLNPYIGLIGPSFEGAVKNVLANVGLQYRILPGLILKTTMGYNWLTGRSAVLSPLAIIPPLLRNGRSGSSQHYRYEAISRIIEPQATYRLTKGSWQLHGLLGGTIQGYQEMRESLNADGFEDDALLRNIYYADSVYGKLESGAYRYVALFGRFGLNYQNRYLMNLSIRRDGSSRFGPRKQFASFGAIGTAWIFSEEPFMTPLKKVISFGKIRASYGTTGNDQIGDYQYLGEYNKADGAYQGVTGLKPVRLFNADFAWELTRKSEVALDLGFLHDRLLLSASYYLHRSSNQLISYPLPDITGAGSIIGNLPAVIRNNGLELSLSVERIQHNKLIWRSSFNISFGHNKLISYPDPTIPVEAVNPFVEGQALSQQYVATAMGVDPQTGTYQFADAENHPVPAAKAVENKAMDVAPFWYGGWVNNLDLGPFSMEILLHFVRQKGVNTTFDPDYMPGYQRNQYAVVQSRWQQPGDITDRQRYTQNGTLWSGYRKAMKSDLGYEDASFLRVRHVEVNWSFPKTTLRRLHLQEGKLYIQGQNLFTITRYKGLDPETQLRGTLPPLRVFTCGLKIAL
ncbi:SusC/RagA family TonB-linked outer membrane protein [Chitinophaga agri]|uniref:SusC/RagA family TonB-linked outer membrane protein n=1 Tax=Chitinophaga agri TaxID=2703787 RepID=A0A6B9ZKB9_9BACT|nr:SusC/RagA family TonB-linked outer membrane protein [Chitinophaga agri]QHS61073.1 SusC/RagA family TonB-linked outer membrane protein [Chitinophaga agri]